MADTGGLLVGRCRRLLGSLFLKNLLIVVIRSRQDLLVGDEEACMHDKHMLCKKDTYALCQRQPKDDHHKHGRIRYSVDTPP